MDVNYYGPIRVTKAALPLLKRYGRGGSAAARIININSTSGLLPGLPLKGGKTPVPGRSMGVVLQTRTVILCLMVKLIPRFFCPMPYLSVRISPSHRLQRLETRGRGLVQLPPPGNAAFQYPGHGRQPILARYPVCLAAQGEAPCCLPSGAPRGPGRLRGALCGGGRGGGVHRPSMVYVEGNGHEDNTLKNSRRITLITRRKPSFDSPRTLVG